MKTLWTLLCALLLAFPAFGQSRLTTYGNITAANASCAVAGVCVTLELPAEVSGVSVQITGTYTGTNQFEASADGTTYTSITGYPLPSGSGVTSTTSTGQWQFTATGMKYLRVRGSAHASGTTVVNIAGTSGAFIPPAAASVTVGSVDQGTAGVSAWLVTGTGGTFPATQSGNWAVRNQDGTGNALTSASRGSERALSVQIVDGSGTQVTSFGGAGGTSSNFGSAFPAAGTAVGFSDGTNMQGVRAFDLDSGAGTQYGMGVNLRSIGSGGSAEIGVAANPLQVSLANTAANATALNVSAVQSGAWTAAQSGNWAVRLQDGSGNAITSTSQALDVNVKSGITADVAEGTAASTPATVAGMAETSEAAAVDDGDVVRFRTSTVGHQVVNVGALPQDHWQKSSAGTAIADTTFVAVVAHTDNQFSVVTNLLVTNSDATVGTVVKVVMGTGTLCDTGTAIIWEGYAAALGGGFALANADGLFSTTAHSNDICIGAVTTSAEITWSMSGYKTALDRVSN